MSLLIPFPFWVAAEQKGRPGWRFQLRLQFQHGYSSTALFRHWY